ncbi:hypothetical protein [Gordonia sputi]|uniref:hypothetical protein n=1 Tax=Gordonia sputi TaxID=36823 RepID=UPI00227065AA|nr:hypothetical protein [Gordonia sputi]
MARDYDSRLASLIDGLTERTSSTGERKLSWSEEPGDIFELNLRRTTLRVRSKDRDGAYPYLFEILDDEARLIERVEVDIDSDTFSRVHDLYMAAVRNARNVDEVVDSLFEELDIEEPPF